MKGILPLICQRFGPTSRLARGFALLAYGQRGARVSADGSMTSPEALRAERDIQLGEVAAGIIGALRPTSDYRSALRLVGTDGDGGYWILRKPVSSVVSCGVGGDVSFESALGEEGASSLLVDNSVDELPSAVRGGRFVQATVGSGPREMNLQRLRLEFTSGGAELRPDALLKLDVEGAEWAVLTDEAELGRYEQIVVEFHSLHLVAQRDFAERAKRAIQALTARHTPVFLSPNNCCGVALIGGVPLPRVAEVTFIRDDILAAHTEAVPMGANGWEGPIRQPNVSHWAPIKLWDSQPTTPSTHFVGD